MKTHSNIRFDSLAHTTLDMLFKAFSKAFADYELQLNKAQLQSMLQRRGFNPDLSFAAFDGDEIVAFTFNGTGSFQGIPTAYDTGTGTLQDYRGKGLATQVFEYSLPYLKQHGVQQYLLEVLQHNTKAVSVYRNLGFEVVREFYYSNQKNDEIRNEIRKPGIPYEIKPINPVKCQGIPSFRDFYPSWQNNFESILRASDEFISLGIFIENKLIAYSVFEPASGDITQIAVDKNYRRKGFGSLLLQHMLKTNKNDCVKAINTDITCDSIKGFLEAKNILVRGKQFEMIKTL